MADGTSLGAVFAAAAQRPELGADPQLSALLGELHATAWPCWPGVTLAAETFVRHLAVHLAPAADPRVALRALHVVDLYLACACAQGDPNAIALVERQYIERAPRLIDASDRGALADDLKQDLRCKLLVQRPEAGAGIAGYAGTGTLESWMRVATLRSVCTLRRDQRRPMRRCVELDPQTLLAAPDPEADYLRVRYSRPFEQALRRAMRGLEPRQRNLLRLHYLAQISIERLGRLHNVSRATMARWLAAARQTLLDDTYRLLAEELHLSRPEFESLLHCVKSEIGLSIQRSFSASA